MPIASQLFLTQGNRKSVYNIQAISNIPSVIRHGLLSYNRAAEVEHTSIALSEVQARRATVIVPNGNPLHAYASAYFDPRNPMMYKRKDIAETLCVLAISPTVLDIEGTVITDGNAASPYSRFYRPAEGLQALDFVSIYAAWWTDEDDYVQANKKRMKCAEILIPNAIPYNYIIGAYTVNESAKEQLQMQGFQKPIYNVPKIFFREGGSK